MGSFGGQLKARIVELTVEVEDADKALELLGSAMDKEARAHREEVLELENDLAFEWKEVTTTEREALMKIVKEADSLVKKKEVFSGRCKACVEKVKDRELRWRQRMADNEKVFQEVTLLKAKAAFDRGAADRKKKYIEAETAKIRSITVQGLEPEVRRLVDDFQAELADLEAKKLRDEKILETEIQELQFATKVDELRQSYSMRKTDAQEKKREETRKTLDLVEDQHRRSYQRTTQQRADATAKLRSELANAAQKSLRQFQDELKRETNKAQATVEVMEDTYHKERRDRSQLFQRARAAVAAAQCAEEAALEEEARREYEEKVDEAAEMEIQQLRDQRDTAIDETIRRLQSRDYEDEEAQKHRASATRAELKAAHVEAIADARRRRAEWVDKRVAALTEVQNLRDRLQHLRSRETALSQDLADKEALAKPKRKEIDRHAKDLASKLDALQKDHAKHLVKLRDEHVASLAALDAVQALKRRHDHHRQRRRYDFEQSRETNLTNRDVQVKHQLNDLDTELRQIQEAIDLEHLRYTHLTKLLRNYMKKRSPSATDSSSQRDPPCAGGGHSTTRNPPPPSSRRIIGSSSRANSAGGPRSLAKAAGER